MLVIGNEFGHLIAMQLSDETFFEILKLKV
jgi:hypothetical protein